LAQSAKMRPHSLPHYLAGTLLGRFYFSFGAGVKPKASCLPSKLSTTFDMKPRHCFKMHKTPPHCPSMQASRTLGMEGLPPWGLQIPTSGSSTTVSSSPYWRPEWWLVAKTSGINDYLQILFCTHVFKTWNFYSHSPTLLWKVEYAAMLKAHILFL
jgi:hypothetical protein